MRLFFEGFQVLTMYHKPQKWNWKFTKGGEYSFHRSDQSQIVSQEFWDSVFTLCELSFIPLDTERSVWWKNIWIQNGWRWNQTQTWGETNQNLTIFKSIRILTDNWNKESQMVFKYICDSKFPNIYGNILIKLQKNPSYKQNPKTTLRQLIRGVP